MKFNIMFVFSGPNGEIEAPNNKNPVECENLASLLLLLAKNMPTFPQVKPVGIRIEVVK